MTDIDEIEERLDAIETSIPRRPGDAQEDLESIVGEIGDAVADRLIDAQRLLENEDFPGAAQLLIENGIVYHRTAGLALELREQIRRRR